MRIEMPKSLRLEHDELQQFLASAEGARGEFGRAARRVARLLEPHFRRELAFAMPPLGLLARLAQGELDPGMGEVLAQTEWLKANLATLLAEHHMIVAALERLLAAAQSERRDEWVEFAERLMNHARMEEEVMYPAAILVGEYLKLRLGKRGHEPAPLATEA
jgi:hypothetical protein